FAASVPTALGRAAGRDPAGEQLDLAAGREADRRSTAYGDVTTGRDEAVARDQLERGVDCQRLDHAVEIERRSRRPREQPPGETKRPPGAVRRGSRRPLVVSEFREVLVV